MTDHLANAGNPMPTLKRASPELRADREIELERLLADERELTQQLRGEAAVLTGLLRDCDLELAAIEAEDYRKGGEWVFLRAAIDIALNPINREGSLL